MDKTREMPRRVALSTVPARRHPGVAHKFKSRQFPRGALCYWEQGAVHLHCVCACVCVRARRGLWAGKGDFGQMFWLVAM